MSTAIRLSGVSRSYGANTVVSDISLDITVGAFVSLLGPSGCGKTTLLNLIAGLDRPSSGEIHMGSDLVYSRAKGVDVPIERRNIGYVFQTYALWPHMSVLQNVAFALKLRSIGRAERERRALAVLERLDLHLLADRYPFQLSGGQQQRVAIARLLAYEPRVLLLDEPLSNLDAQLRERARAWLKEIHDKFGLTVILVTHDQSEALSLSNQIVLLNKGRIEQIGAADEIYERPSTAYSAEFVGGSNVLAGQVTAIAGKRAEVRTTGGGDVTLSSRLTMDARVGDAVVVAIRPQKVI